MTDAYLLLGLLDPSAPLGGSLGVQETPARRAMARLATELGLEVEACAHGVMRVLEAQLGKALRVVSVERGRDPRGYALLAFGGAGPLHQGPLARELGCATVVVPRYPGVLAAIGLLAAPRSVDAARTVLGGHGAVRLEASWAELDGRASDELRRQGVEPARLVRSADCRYQGQAHELEVPAPSREGADPVRALGEAFEAAHRERYGYVHQGEQVEIVTLRARAEGREPVVSMPPAPPGHGAASARRGVRRIAAGGAGGGTEEADVYDREALGAGDRFVGPAVVSAVDSTCLVLAGQVAEVDGHGNLLIREG